MSALQGRRLEATKLHQWPRAYQALLPGDYWQILHPETAEPLTNDSDLILAQAQEKLDNLVRTVWGVIAPNGVYGILAIHTVREESDGTISVKPGDGSYNSIYIPPAKDDGESWEGFIDHGVWRSEDTIGAHELVSSSMEVKLDGIDRILGIAMTPRQRAIMAVYLQNDVPPDEPKTEVHYLRKRKTT